MTRWLPRVAICYDIGSAGPIEILRAMRGLCHPVWVVCPHRALKPQMALMSDTGELVVVATGQENYVASRLRKVGVSGITTFSERMVRFTASVAADLGLPFHSPATAARLTDKLKQRTALAAAGDPIRYCMIEIPDYCLPVDYELLFPAILKPAVSHGSIDTYHLVDAAALHHHVHALANRVAGQQFILEQYHPGPSQPVSGLGADYVSVESITFNGIAQHVFITGKLPMLEPFLETGSFMPTDLESDHESKVLEVATRALSVLGVECGLTHTEIKITDDGPRVIEVNGRLGGETNPLAKTYANIDLVQLGLKASLGILEDSVQVQGRGVSFEYGRPAPLGATMVTGISDIERSRTIPGVRTVEVRRPVGSMLDWRDPYKTYTVAVTGWVPGHDELADLIALLNATLRIDYDNTQVS